jgi:hypothetical protein
MFYLLIENRIKALSFKETLDKRQIIVIYVKISNSYANITIRFYKDGLNNG